MAWWRIAGAALLLGGLAAVAIGAVLVDQRREREFAASRTPPPMVQPPSPSPSASPSPTRSPSPSEEHLPANDVDDPVEALYAIIEYRDWLYANPDPERVELIYDHRCPCFEPIRQEFEAMADAGWWSTGETKVSQVKLEPDRGPRDATVEFETITSDIEIFDGKGQVVERQESDGLVYRWRALLFLGVDGRWRITAIRQLG